MWARVLLASYLVVVAVIVLEPSNGLPSSSIVAITDALVARGLPPWLVSYGAVEVATNVLLFVPLTLLGRFAVRRWSWWTWLLVAVALSVGIELTQDALLPARTPSASDVASNAAGAVVGLLLAAPLRWWSSRRRARVRTAPGGGAGTGTSSARGRAPTRSPGGRSGRAGS